ncbi:MAG: GNAT family N-acetyltransferase [Bacillota bacterium]|nr:GNAT family N-acetyltransferase [Bacillota bacterium]
MIEIKKCKRSELDGALPLIWEVFQQYEVCEHPEVFYEAIHDENYLDTLSAYGAYLGKEFVGIIATRNQGRHIALFFVKSEYQGKGIGRMLMEKVWEENTYPILTVHSSIYAQKIYEKLGFKITGNLQNESGIHFIPMEYRVDIIDYLIHQADKKAYTMCKNISALSSETNEFYSYKEDFLRLLKHQKSYVRTRGFALLCAQSKWDTEGFINKHLEEMLSILNDEKPTVVRQSIKSLYEVVLYKPELFARIKVVLKQINVEKYKDSMSPLIKKDIQEFLKGE